MHWGLLMCEVCKTVAGEVREFAEKLVEKYPGESVEGTPVPLTHHVFVALYEVANEYARKELEFVRANLMKEAGHDVLFSTREGQA